MLVRSHKRTRTANSDGDLIARLERLGADVPDVSRLLTVLAQIVTRWGLVEFRPQLDMLLDQLGSGSLEIAVFGRVSSGKSSLLNHVACRDVLPVGVTPVTAVPTRLTWGPVPLAVVSFAVSSDRQVELDELVQFAAEQQNPGNVRLVTRIEVELPAPRLRSGIVFVDTPGVGSLARSGSAETFAYLPRCDLGIVLVDASSPINEDDLRMLRLLLEAGIPAQVLLSKVDLVAPLERQRAVDYVRRQIDEQLRVSLPVWPVSIIGGDEELLDAWLHREIVPLGDQHGQLKTQSLRRKVAQVARTLLEALEDKGRPAAASRLPAGNDASRISQLLQHGDDLVRQLKSESIRWRDHAPDSAITFAEQAASQIVAERRRGSSGVDVIREVAGEAFHERAQRAWRPAAETQSQLAETLRAIAQAHGAVGVDAEAIQKSQLAGLPSAEWDLPEGAQRITAPWWSDVAPPLARQWVRQKLLHEIAPELRRVVEMYDRSLDLWLRTTSTGLQRTYEAQVAVLRSRLRQARGGNGQETPAAVDDLQQDISELRRALGAASHDEALEGDRGDGRGGALSKTGGSPRETEASSA